MADFGLANEGSEKPGVAKEGISARAVRELGSQAVGFLGHCLG